MAAITFLSPRRGTGTTTAIAAATSSLFQTATHVEVIDRTANEDFTRWWPEAPPEPERVDAHLTLIDAHEPDHTDSLVIVVYDPLTEPAPGKWISALLKSHPHLTIIGAIANRTVDCPSVLDLPNGTAVRIKPLPNHHLFHDAAMQNRWPLDLPALSQTHITFPTLALGPHINIAVTAAPDLQARKAHTAEAEPAVDDTQPIDVIEIIETDEHDQAEPTDEVDELDQPDQPDELEASNDEDVEDDAIENNETEIASDELMRRVWVIPHHLKSALWECEAHTRRTVLQTAIEDAFADPEFQPAPTSSTSSRTRADTKWNVATVEQVEAAAAQHDCTEYQIVAAALDRYFEN